LEEEGKGKTTIDAIGSKLRTTFAVFVVFVIMTVVAVIFLGIEISPTQEKQQQGSDITPSSLLTSKLTGLVEELENQNSSFLEKTKTDDSQKEYEYLVLNHFSELNCDELSDIPSSFEDGWGRALVEYGSKCGDDIIP